MLVAELYRDAAELETLYGLLVIKNGRLIAEKYFNEGSVEQLSKRASVTKSYTSALVGIALDQGCLSSVDQKMIDFFPEVTNQITDPRKKQIKIRDMLQMRAGYPWEETDPALWEALWSGSYLNDIFDFPLTCNPGTEFQYSNLTSHWPAISNLRRAIWPSLACYISTTVNTRESRSFQPVGSRNHCRATRMMSIPQELNLAKWAVTSATSDMAITGGPPAPAASVSISPGGMADS
jgi:hypothetical protein